MTSIPQNYGKIKSKKSRVNIEDQLIGKMVKAYRLKLGIRLVDVGNALDISIQQVQKYEMGVNRISSGNLKAVSELFKIPISSFFVENNKPDYLENEVNEIVNKEVEDTLLLQLFKNIKNSNLKKAIIELINCLPVN